jgi:hypothetical protein
MLFAKPLLSNGCCIFAYFAVVAQQCVYMPQYIADMFGLLNELHIICKDTVQVPLIYM